jgi:hypothetical protein
MNSLQIATVRILSTLSVVAVLLFSADWDKATADRPPAEGSHHTMVEQYGCHANVVDPTHVVVTTADGVTRYGGQRLTDKAIEQEVFNMDHGLIVHAFCP